MLILPFALRIPLILIVRLETEAAGSGVFVAAGAVEGTGVAVGAGLASVCAER
jgi:hypothetical protein